MGLLGSLKSRRALLLCTLLASLPLAASSQSYPTRTINVILPFGPSTVDTSIRLLGGEAAKVLGQPVVFENRPGGQNRLGYVAMKNAPADGYSLTVGLDDLLVSQPVADPAFKAELGKDYVPVAFVMEIPLVLTANASLPFRDVKGMIAYAKQNPGKLDWAVSANTEDLAKRIARKGGFSANMISYRGAAQAYPDIVSGRVHLLFSGSSIAQFITSGKLHGLATTGLQRWSPFPDLPTLIEADLGLSRTLWFGLIAHPDTSADIVSKLNAAFNAGLKNPEFLKLVQKFGINTRGPLSAREFGEIITAEIRAARGQ